MLRFPKGNRFFICPAKLEFATSIIRHAKLDPNASRSFFNKKHLEESSNSQQVASSRFG